METKELCGAACPSNAVIDTLYPFHDALAAYEHLYRGAFGKIVIRVKQ
jgi:NADPH:quinone reductase-like Zn-dependent oxidoreductase